MYQDKIERKYVLVFLLIIVIISQILQSYSARPAVDENQLNTLYWIRHLFSFGIPSLLLFWQASEIRAYTSKLPKNYFTSRFKFIFLPYLIFGGAYSLFLSQSMDSSLWEIFKRVILQGHWHGYFILIIFQFTLLNMIFNRLNIRPFKSLIAVGIAFIFSVIYLYFTESGLMSSVPNPFFNNDANILGWLFFYALGSFVGHHYDKVKELSKDYVVLVIFGGILSYGIFIALNLQNNLIINILNPALLLYHSFAFLFIFQLALNSVGFKDHLIELIEPYLMFALLFHPIIISYLYDLFGIAEEQTVLLLLSGLVLILGISIGVGMILGQFTITRFALGKFSPIDVPIPEKSKDEQGQTAELELD